MRTIRRLLVLAVVTSLLSLAGCGDDDEDGSDTTTTTEAPTTTVDAEAATAEITENWEAFFNGALTLDERITYLEDGEELQALVEEQAQLLGEQAAAATAEVKDVVLEDDGTATITFDILLSGARPPALPDFSGTAVLVEDTWVVSKLTLCDLLSLAGQLPTECEDVGA